MYFFVAIGVHSIGRGGACCSYLPAIILPATCCVALGHRGERLPNCRKAAGKDLSRVVFDPKDSDDTAAFK
jgi:hypothetical protein